MSDGGTSAGGGGGHGGHHGSPYRRLIRLTRPNQIAPHDGGGPFHSPPYLSFDPALEADRRAAQRSVIDIGQDTRTAARRSRRDFRTTRADIRTDFRRNRADVRKEGRRQLQDIGYQRQDTRRELGRGKQDFGLQLAALTRRFTQMAGQHLQQAAAYGSLDSGTMGASDAARAQNFAFERQPLDINLQRLKQDSRTTFGRLETAAHQTRSDVRQEVQRGRQDRRHDVRLARQDYHRTIKDLHIKLSRAIREQRIGDIDIIKQEIYAARNSPGGKNQFSKYGKKTGKD
jgi:hypothetical protein